MAGAGPKYKGRAASWLAMQRSILFALRGTHEPPFIRVPSDPPIERPHSGRRSVGLIWPAKSTNREHLGPPSCPARDQVPRVPEAPTPSFAPSLRQRCTAPRPRGSSTPPLPLRLYCLVSSLFTTSPPTTTSVPGFWSLPTDSLFQLFFPQSFTGRLSLSQSVNYSIVVSWAAFSRFLFPASPPTKPTDDTNPPITSTFFSYCLLDFSTRLRPSRLDLDRDAGTQHHRDSTTTKSTRLDLDPRTDEPPRGTTATSKSPARATR